MLQQTRVETVIPFYKRWMERFPALADLAAASEQEVLTHWEGLGYYSRARNLHKAARIVMEEMGGNLPADPGELIKLPGIGSYTAAAIASIAFGVNVPALDGNIRRVFTRMFDIEEPIQTPGCEKLLRNLAAAHLPVGRASEYNQALMDLGALICTPQTPACQDCPLEDFCLAKARGTQRDRPVRLARGATPHYTVTAAVICRAGSLLITQRPADGLLGGLWEFPGGKVQPDEQLAECLKREILEELGSEIEVGKSIGTYRHAYTHFRVTLHAFLCRLYNSDQPQPIQVQDLRWVHPDELAAFPMGKIDRQIAIDLQALEKIC